MRIVFDEGVLLPDANPETAFSINPYNDPSSFLEIEKAEYQLSDLDLKTVILTTKEQKADQNYVITAGINLTNLAGSPVVSGVYDTGLFVGSEKIMTDAEISTLTGSGAPEVTSSGTTTTEEPQTGSGQSVEPVKDVDLTPPEEITGLMITQKLLELNKYLVSLSWTKSLNSAGDLIDQLVYQSLNRGQTYDKGTSL